MQGYEVTQSSTAYPLVFLMISLTDHITGLTGASPTVTISKNGGSFATPSGAVTEIGNGWYKVAGNATDTATLGPILLHATATGGDPTDMMFPVVAVNPQSSAYGLSLAKTTNITGFNDIAATAIVSSGAITTSSGAVATVASVTGAVTVSLTQTLGAARALDSIADTSLTVNDALHCAIAGVAGKQSTSGTSYTVETPSTGTVLRTFTLTLISLPTTVPSARA